MRVPRLLLQPLLDSALRRSDDPGQTLLAVKLQAREQDGRLLLQVSDQGGGGDGEPDIGLDNAAERIRRLYGEGFGLHREAAPEGSRLTVELPLLPGPAPVQPVRTRLA
jgi:two-component system, LytTR family, sensor kinase